MRHGDDPPPLYEFPVHELHDPDDNPNPELHVKQLPVVGLHDEHDEQVVHDDGTPPELH